MASFYPARSVLQTSPPKANSNLVPRSSLPPSRHPWTRLHHHPQARPRPASRSSRSFPRRLPLPPSPARRSKASSNPSLRLPTPHPLLSRPLAARAHTYLNLHGPAPLTAGCASRCPYPTSCVPLSSPAFPSLRLTSLPHALTSSLTHLAEPLRRPVRRSRTRRSTSRRAASSSPLRRCPAPQCRTATRSTSTSRAPTQTSRTQLRGARNTC